MRKSLPWLVCIFSLRPYSNPHEPYPATKRETLEHRAVLNCEIVYHSDRQQPWNLYYNRTHFYTTTTLSTPMPIARSIRPLYQICVNWFCCVVLNRPDFVSFIRIKWKSLINASFTYRLGKGEHIERQINIITAQHTLYWSRTKYSAKMSVWLKHWSTAFIKHVFPWFCKPTTPGTRSGGLACRLIGGTRASVELAACLACIYIINEMNT